MTLTILAYTILIQSQDLTGTWNGALEVSGMQLRIVFHVSEDNGTYTSTMDSPDQGAFGIETDETKVNGNEINIKVNKLKIDMTGTFDPETNVINAEFKQGPMKLPLKLTREEVKEKVYNRPQEPTSFDYKVEEVTFINENGGHKLAGTLTIPKDGKFEKVAILVSGSGPQDRNEELLQHKPFLVLSDYLTRNGVAVLRYDDRGVGASEGDFKLATSDDFAFDAEAAMAFLKNREDMAGKKIGIIGHSEGGMIAPIVASRTDIDFIVLLAGPGTSLDQLLKDQTRLISEVEGESADDIASSLEGLDATFKVLAANEEKSNEEVSMVLQKELVKLLNGLDEKKKEEIGDLEEYAKSQADGMTTNWFRFFIHFSPKDYLTKVHCPTLAVNGSLDLQVPSEDNLNAISKYLSQAGNTNFAIKEFEGLNHLFQKTETGAPSEYVKNEETFNEGMMKFVTNWIHTFDL